MFCPQCKSEYRTGFTECGHCKVPLVESLTRSLSDDDAEAYFKDKPTELVTAGYVAMVKEVQGMLEAEGIPARIVPVDEKHDAGGNMHQMFRLEIARDDVERFKKFRDARWNELIEKEGVKPGELREAVLSAGAETECPACATKFTPANPEAAECPECGLFLGVPG